MDWIELDWIGLDLGESIADPDPGGLDWIRPFQNLKNPGFVNFIYTKE